MSKLDGVFDSYGAYLTGRSDAKELDLEEATQKVKDLMLEMIGEGRVLNDYDMDREGWSEYRKKQYSMKDLDEADRDVRAELRDKVKAL